jgi:rhodanese-related sulfurtransferase/DNA-binding transcriptional ArsR family regulator
MGNREAKDALFDGFAGVAKALANGRRAELIDVLAQGERHVDDLASEIGQSVANTSHHLQQLAGAGLVRTRREKTRIYYRLASGDVELLWATIRDVAEKHLDHIDELAADYLGNRDALEEISRDELGRRIADGDLIVIDVRPEAEYAAGHVNGARSIPIAELAASVEDLPPDVEIVAYCRGPYCVFADDAVRLLRRHDRKARRLQDGFPEWRSEQFPVTTGAPPR